MDQRVDETRQADRRKNMPKRDRERKATIKTRVDKRRERQRELDGGESGERQGP